MSINFRVEKNVQAVITSAVAAAPLDGGAAKREDLEQYQLEQALAFDENRKGRATNGATNRSADCFVGDASKKSGRPLMKTAHEEPPFASRGRMKLRGRRDREVVGRDGV